MPLFTPIDIARFINPDRREVIRTLGLGAGFFLTESTVSQHLWAKPFFKADPFSLGVASGDPAADGFVIWTRLAPAPLKTAGGMPPVAVEVAWELAADEAFLKPVRSGKAIAKPAMAHAIHVEIGGLETGREYFYRFSIEGIRSPVGRAKTFPVPSAAASIRFVSAGCQRYEDGFFTAWRAIAQERPDFVAHYGDYIYEYKAIKPDASRPVPIARDMPGMPEKCLTLNDFRQRYAIYKLDPDLQAAHAAAPFLSSFDDHEVENNWAGFDSEYEGVSKRAFALRRAAAFQAWYEHTPLRAAQMPKGPDILAYRRFRLGDLLQVDMLDTRQYRDPQPCGDGWKYCVDARDERRTMLGKAQESWLFSGFAGKPARWNLIAQQVPMMRFDRDPDSTLVETHMDKWDGAEAARKRLFDAAKEAKLANLVVLAGDVHHNRAAELKVNFDDPASANIGVEFVATSISSGGDGEAQPKSTSKLMQANPHLKFFNAQRGYVAHTLDAARWRADYRVLDKVSTKDGAASTRASFVVESGKPVLEKA
ncbi:MAG: alkaline phosphatase D family protein [Proteobacteria bacterium]|nr:alkaline phosphatase D family protein [Pseudomonadota bacterium]